MRWRCPAVWSFRYVAQVRRAGSSRRVSRVRHAYSPDLPASRKISNTDLTEETRKLVAPRRRRETFPLSTAWFSLSQCPLGMVCSSRPSNPPWPVPHILQRSVCVRRSPAVDSAETRVFIRHDGWGAGAQGWLAPHGIFVASRLGPEACRAPLAGRIWRESRREDLPYRNNTKRLEIYNIRYITRRNTVSI